MKCTLCGCVMDATTSDLPFKISEKTIVIVKELPVIQCSNCSEYLIADSVMAELDKILATVAQDAELEVIRYAA